MPNNYNVDDILDEIKRKKSESTSTSLPQRRREAQEPSSRRERSYDDYDERTARTSARREGYEESYAPAPKRRRDEFDGDYDDRPRRTAARRDDYDDDYPPAPKRRRDEFDGDYDERPRRAAARRADYEEDYPPAPKRRRNEFEDDYDERPRRAAARRDDYEEDYPPAPKRRRDEFEDGYDDRSRRTAARRADYEEDYPPAPKRRREEYDEEYDPQPRRSTRRSSFEEDYAPEPRRQREIPLSQDTREDDLSILRDRISLSETPKKNRFEVDIEDDETDGAILTDRDDILRNFGRGKTMAKVQERASDPLDEFKSSRAAKKREFVLEQYDDEDDIDPPAAMRRSSRAELEDYSETQMNIDIYSLDDEGERVRPVDRSADPNQADDDISSDVDDFNTPKDANNVYRDIRSIKIGLRLRFGLIGIIFACLLYFAFAMDNVALPLLSFMLPESNMQMFMGVNLALLLAAALICYRTVGGGLLSLFRMRANNDSPIAIATVVALAQGAVLVAFPEAMIGAGVHFYFAPVALGLLFNVIGKMFMISRIERNFKLLADGGYQRHAFNIINDRSLARELVQDQNLDTPVVGYSHPAEFLTNFLYLSYTEDYGENISRITTPLFLLFGVIASGITQFIYGDVFVSLTAFAALTAICAPITTTIVGNLPLKRMNKALVADGSMVAGYTALDKFDDVNCLVIKDSELFGPQSITLHGIKPFDQKRIDEAMIDAASVVCKSECVLNAIFTQMIGGNERLLKKADSIVYEDSMGISAWVDGKRVLIGNRSLMKNHSIEIPSRDYERKFVRDGREVLYLSNSGELTAMFVLSYGADPDIADELDILASKGIGIAVYTTDSNITPQKISEVFNFPEDMVEIVPYKLHSQCDKLLEPKQRAKAEIVYDGSLASKVRALSAIISAKTAIVLGTILQSIGMVAGYGLIAFFAFTNSIGAVSFALLTAYQLFWAAVVILLANMRRY